MAKMSELLNTTRLPKIQPSLNTMNSSRDSSNNQQQLTAERSSQMSLIKRNLFNNNNNSSNSNSNILFTLSNSNHPTNQSQAANQIKIKSNSNNNKAQSTKFLTIP
jgi:hypothetical protein